MPNIKSAEKRVSVIAKKKLQNQMIRSRMNTAVKKFNAAISNSDLEAAKALLPLTMSEIDQAAKKNIIHKNSANHKKAQICTALYQLENGIIAIKVDAKTQKQTEQKAAAVKKAEAEKAIREARTAARAKKEAEKAPAPETKKKAAAPKKEVKKDTKKEAEKAPKKTAEKEPKKAAEKAPAKKAAKKEAPAQEVSDEVAEDEIK